MRTTLTIDERLARDLKEIAHRSGKPFKQVVNETLRAGLSARKAAPPTRRYRLKPASLGRPLPGVDLHKALQLSETLEDLEIARKLDLRK